MNSQIISIFFWQSLLLASSLFAFTVPVVGKEIPNTNTSSNQLLPLVITAKTVEPTKEIRSLNQTKRSSTQIIVQSPTPIFQTEVIPVMRVKVNSSDKGLEVVLETTANSDKLQVTPKTDGNSYIADIPNAQLRLTSGDRFRQEKPVPGIAEITVTNIDANSIRVTVTGEAGAPAVELFDSTEGLVFGVSAAATTTQQPTTTPDQKQPAIELEVIGKPDTGYSVNNANTATKTDTPLRDVPATVQVIPQELIRDQGATNLDQAIKNAPSVQQSSTSNFGFANNYQIRGLQQTFLRDGIRDDLTVNGYYRTLTDVERVEISRGPGSALYGSLDPGGTINLISKKPQATPSNSIQLGVGSFGFVRGTVDFTGPVNDDKTLLYRFISSYSQKDGYRGLGNEIIEVLPRFTWKPNNFNTINFNFDYRHIELIADTYGIPFLGNRLLNVPPEFRYYSPFSNTTQDIYRGYLAHEWQINENLQLSNKLNVLYRDLFLARNASSSLFVGNTNRLDNRLFRDETDKNLEVTYQTEFLWNTATGDIKHKILAGLEYQYKNYSFVRNTFVFAPITNAFNPVVEQSRNQRRSFIRDYDVTLTANYLGVYLQDEIKFSDQFKARVGGRFDSFPIGRSGYVNAANNNNTIVLSQFQGDLNGSSTRFSYQAGLVYQPLSEVSFYGGVSRSNLAILSPQGVPSNIIDPPESGLQYELGIKTDLFNKRLQANLVFFDTSREDFIVVINTIRQPVGAQKTQGIELDISAEPLDGWKIYAGYALYNAKLTKLPNAPNLEGNIPTGVPNNAASLWTSYEIQYGDLKGLGIGGGLTFRDSIFQDQENTKVIPGYVTFDLALFYRHNDFEARLNFYNITDEQYFRNGVNSGALPGEPFSVQGSVSFKF